MSQPIEMLAPSMMASAEAGATSLKGRVGILALILTESSFFSIFVAAYIFYIGKSLSGPSPREVLEVPVLNTICLLSSSLTIVAAVRSLRRGSQYAFGIWWLATFLLGAEFLLGTIFEWRRLIYQRGLTIHTNLFGTTYYSLVGLHAAHVTIGLLGILIVLILAMLGCVSERHNGKIDLLSWYWHFVDSVWVVVFLVVYVVGR